MYETKLEKEEDTKRKKNAAARLRERERERERERVIKVKSTDVERGLRAVQAKGAKRALLEGGCRGGGGIGLGDVVPSAAVDLLAANQTEAGAHKILIVVEQLGKMLLGGLGVQRQGLGLGGSGGSEGGTDTQRLTDEKARFLRAGGGCGEGLIGRRSGSRRLLQFHRGRRHFAFLLILSFFL